MPKYIVELWLDGYNSEEETAKACREFIYDQLNMTASSVTITEYNETDGESDIQLLAELNDGRRVVVPKDKEHAEAMLRVASFYLGQIGGKQ